MLPAGSRLHTSDDFAEVVRSGRRAGTRHLVVHLLGTGRPTPPRAGFVAPAKVGNSVVRHRVTRRLRPLVRLVVAGLAAGDRRRRPGTARGRGRQQRRPGPGSAVRDWRRPNATGIGDQAGARNGRHR